MNLEKKHWKDIKNKEDKKKITRISVWNGELYLLFSMEKTKERDYQYVEVRFEHQTATVGSNTHFRWLNPT